MSGERDLKRLLACMRPQLDAECYVFVSVPEDAVPPGLRAFATIREDEGITLVLTSAAAEAAGLVPGFKAARITLRVHSDLEAVGLTAAVSARLATAGIACNVVAGAFHDHLLVPWERREEAHALLSRAPSWQPAVEEDRPMRSQVVAPEGVPRLVGSVVAALAWILGVEVTAVALPPDGHPEPWTVWRGWLGERGLGLVPVREPATVAWPGPWLALLPDAAGGQVAAVAFGVPGGLVWQLPGGTATLADADAGFVVAAADLAAWSAPRYDGRAAGRVEAIGLAPTAEAPIEVLPD